MQTFVMKACFLVVCLWWLMGCRPNSEAPLSPTPIIGGVDSAVSTPTLVPTPTPLPSPTPNPFSLGDPYMPAVGNRGYDVQRYTLQLALDPAERWLSGTTIIEAVATAEAKALLSLDFLGPAVIAVNWEESGVPFTREGGKLLIELPYALPAGQPFRLTISYAGEPVSYISPYAAYAPGLGLTFAEGNVYTLSEPDGARAWFPANDHPRDKALFRFEVTVPEPYTAVANGQLKETIPADPGYHTFIWEHQHPMATYLALVAVGEYERIDGVSAGGVPLRHYIFPEEMDNFAPVEALTGPAIDWMGQLFGPYPFETFGFVMVRDLPLAMEAQTLAMMSPSLTGKRTAVHELSHMWFGNWVSLDSWAAMWRNEGFATYVELLWRFRDDPAGLEVEMQNLRGAVAANERIYPLQEPPPPFLFDYNVYREGAALAHALRQAMGDDAFFAGLRRYFAQYGGGTASASDFQAVMEAAAGHSLESFFAHWLGDENGQQ